jgi:hypothetical protein
MYIPTGTYLVKVPNLGNLLPIPYPTLHTLSLARDRRVPPVQLRKGSRTIAGAQDHKSTQAPSASFLPTYSVLTPTSTLASTPQYAHTTVQMFLSTILRYLLLLLIPSSFSLTSYLYLYPVFHGCAFPSPDSTPSASFLHTLHGHASPTTANAARDAPFRLLALGDPQLEGDTSLPDPNADPFPHLTRFFQTALFMNDVSHSFRNRIRLGLHDLVDFYFEDIPGYLEGWRKRVDLVGNDFYLAHIYRTLRWWTKPSHVSVLGDLVGSQWIDDKEFAKRGGRWWNNSFSGGERVPDEVTAERNENTTVAMLGDDKEAWENRIINVVGNHDVGYAGDLNEERLVRFEKMFGKANYELRFRLPTSPEPAGDIESTPREPPELRIVVLNDMNLDTPASSKELQDQTYTFLNHIITTSDPVDRPALFTLLLTHIPLYKSGGICVDQPFFSFFDGVNNNGVKEQNHLSLDASKGILEGIFGKSGDASVDGAGMGRHGMILTGHDHEGCDVYHFIRQGMPEEERRWEGQRWPDALQNSVVAQPGIPGLREVTVRSMMGDFGGNAGLLSLWFDEETWEWKSSFVNCALGTQHIWWAVHIVDLILVVVIAISLLIAILSNLNLAQLDVDIPFSNLIPFGKPSSSEGSATTTTRLKITKGKDGSMRVVKASGILTSPGSSGDKSLRRRRSGSSLLVTGGLEKVFENPLSP